MITWHRHSMQERQMHNQNKLSTPVSVGCSVLHGTVKEGESLQNVILGSLAVGKNSFCELNLEPPMRSIFIDCMQRLYLRYNKFLITKPLLSILSVL